MICISDRAMKPAVTRPSGRTYRGETSTQRQEDRRARFIAAATEIIGTQGYAAATVRALCSEAELTERYFYESFSNREDLFCAAYQQAVNQLSERLLQAAASAPQNVEAIARTTLTAFYTMLRDDPRIGRLIYVEIYGVGTQMDQLYRESLDGFADLLVRLARPFFPGGALPGHDEHLLATGLVGAVNSILVYWMQHGYDQPLETVVESAMDIFTALTRHLLAQK